MATYTYKSALCHAGVSDTIVKICELLSEGPKGCKLFVYLTRCLDVCVGGEGSHIFFSFVYVSRNHLHQQGFKFYNLIWELCWQTTP
jgi:C4-dicarboxylate transporter